MKSVTELQELSKLIRYDILTATTEAGSGHATSSLSAVELLVTLFFGGYFHQDLDNPHTLNNDRFILSKGHASPVLYSLYQAAGAVSREELMTLRKLGSHLQGHPTPEFKYADVATGSLGQGLSVGLGMSLGIKLRITNDELRMERKPKIFVLLGDSEVAEGQIWEAAGLASHYKVDNLVAILDVNRLGQRGETMLGWDTEEYEKRFNAFGWNAVVINDGHDIDKIQEVYNQIIYPQSVIRNSQIIIAKTIKGKGVSFLENQDGWHGKPVPKDKLEEALKELGQVNLNLKGTIEKPL